MKKTTFMTIVAACTLGLSSCGTAMGILGQLGQTQDSAQGTTEQTTATTGQTTQQSSQQGSSIGGILSGIGDIISSTLGITTTSIVGTWTYQEPAVLFESDDLLSKAGGQVAAQSIAEKLDSYFQKVGITKGKMTMTFDKDGNFNATIGGKTVSGTYTMEDGNVNLMFQGGMKQFVGTTQFDGNNLVIVMDVTKLMNLAQTIASYSGNSILGSLGTLSANIKGMKAGLKFKK